VTFEETMDNIAKAFEGVGVGVIVVGGLVAVRIALSFSLDIEVDGMLPWRRLETEARLKAAGESDPD